jgi:hypothetical protein
LPTTKRLIVYILSNQLKLEEMATKKRSFAIWPFSQKWHVNVCLKMTEKPMVWDLRGTWSRGTKWMPMIGWLGGL